MTLRARIWTLLLVAVVLALVAGAAVRAGYLNVSRTTTAVAERLQPASDAVAVLNSAPVRNGQRVSSLRADR